MVDVSVMEARDEGVWNEDMQRTFGKTASCGAKRQRMDRLTVNVSKSVLECEHWKCRNSVLPRRDEFIIRYDHVILVQNCSMNDLFVWCDRSNELLFQRVK